VLPFVEDLTSYRATLQRLIRLIDDVDEVIPGHGRRLGRDEALAIARADLGYLDALAHAAERGDVAAALAVTLPRASDDPAMHAHHRANCEAAGLRGQV
jgi:glyoxylase-like metal-dependent hydrolase (beta-lactamase superfamily II)